MTDQWDRFAAGSTQHLQDLGFTNNVDLFQPSETYSNDGDGYDVVYPGTPSETVSGEVVPPSAQEDTDRGGTTREADLVVHVPDDINTAINDAGDSGEALTRLEVDGTDETYEIQVVEEQFDGIYLLECSEVDT